MDGVINVLKPPGMTSSDVVVYLRRLLDVKKIGHTGTLDPGAAGVLPVCVGRATRLASFVTNENKVYRCEMILGMETDTLDSYGKVVSISNCYPDFKDIQRVFSEFQGQLKQYPPMYSAIKYKGKKLYQYAQKNQQVDISPRDILIHRNTILRYTPPNRVFFEVECSKGTYIRALCRDIGRRLKCGAYMGFLLRCSTGEYDIENSYTLAEIREYFSKGELHKILIPLDRIVSHLDRIDVPVEFYQRIIHGNAICVDAQALKLENSMTEHLKVHKNHHHLPGGFIVSAVFVRVYCQGQFIGIAMTEHVENCVSIKMKKVLV